MLSVALDSLATLPITCHQLDQPATHDGAGENGQVDVRVVVGGLGAEEPVGHERAELGGLDAFFAVASGVLRQRER